MKVKEEELRTISESSKDKITIINLKLEQANGKISELEEQINKNLLNITAKEAINEKISKEIDDLKNKMSAVEEENAKLNSQLAELNDLLLRKDTEIQELNNIISQKDNFIEEQTAHLEELEARLLELKPPEILPSDVTTEVRVKCAKCPAVGKDIKIVEDKSKVLSYVSNLPMYAKKHVCKKCGYEF